MEISFNTITIGEHTGYGNASRLLMEALEKRGCKISPVSNVMLNFCMPPDYKHSHYTIGYTPWESTELPPNWLHQMTSVDELWTTSTWTANVFRKYTDRDVFVLSHGIEPCWETDKRTLYGGEKMRFLHVGEPASRKGGDLLLQAWHKAFRNNPNVELVYKCIQYPACRVKDSEGSIVASPGDIGNVKVMTQIMTQRELLSLYHSCHCMVYPTRGEGFGLIPFEAMATGMPVILPDKGGTGDFSSYGISLSDSQFVPSTSEFEHPGMWLNHNVDEIIDRMNYVIDNWSEVSASAFGEGLRIHRDFSWDKIAHQAIDRLILRTDLE